ncbi:MAG: electron transfer flavoprotein subunit beta/FixA family protein [Eubacteriales bacterium]|nr:electron transfer flavoprotein subunit beta/FixA family protein [Eubacteriales bacterium]
MALNIAVCIKVVPNPEQYDKIRLNPETKTLIREGIETVINGADLHAIELAMQLKEKNGGKVTLISMGPSQIQPQMREALSYGCDEAYILSDRKFGGADSLATAYTLAKGVEATGPFDLLLLGNVSGDGATAHVPSQLGEFLNLPHLTDVIAVNLEEEAVLVKKEIGQAVASYRLKLPAVLGIDRKLNKVRHPSVKGIFGAKKKPMKILTVAELKGLEESRLGLSGSPTKAGEYRNVVYSRECTELKDVAELAQIIRKYRG